MNENAPQKKGLVQEFKEFIATGDLMTVAVAFIMGLAIKAVIDSFVKDIFTGTVGLFIKCTDILDPATQKPSGKQDCSGLAGKAYKSLQWGNFANQVFTFLLTAVVVFLLVKVYTKVTRRSLVQGGPSDNDLLKGILDELKSKN
jgi:large conductance mechanosensitive channel